MGFPAGVDPAAFALVVLLSVALTWVVRQVASRLSLVARPNANRWHRKPTALFGGVAIYFSFTAGFLLFVPKEPDNWLLFGCASAMFVIGLVDDLVHLRPHTKLVGQIVVSAVMMYFGAVLHFSASQNVNLLITLVWLVGITNAMNLLDNMDGLCAGIAIIAGFYRLVFCALEGHAAGVTLALVFIAAVAGFLVFNFNPASIFMGDSGSLFVGMLLAGMNISASHTYAKSVFAILLFPVLILAIPIFDTTLVTLTRRLSGRPVSAGGRDHSSHRLVAIGLSERKAVLILYFIGALSGAIAYVLYRRGFSYSIFFLSLFVVGAVLFGIHLGRVRVLREEEGAPRPTDAFSLAADFPYKKQVFMVALDVFLVATAYYGSYWLRFDGFEADPGQLSLLVQSFPVALVFALSCFVAFGLYRRSQWRYTGVLDLWTMVKASVAAVILTVGFLTYLYRFEGYSRSVFVIYGGMLTLLLAATRLSFLFFSEILEVRPSHHKKVLVYGAGDGGELLLRELRNNASMEKSVVGFLDDDPSRLKSRIHGVPVLGGSETAEFWIRKHRIEEIIISSEKIPAAKVAELQEICDAGGVQLLRASMRFEKAAG